MNGIDRKEIDYSSSQQKEPFPNGSFILEYSIGL